MSKKGAREAEEIEAIEVDPFVDPPDEPEPEPEREPEPEPAEPEPEPAPEPEPVEADAEGGEPGSGSGEGESEHEKGLRKVISHLRKENKEWDERWQSLEALRRFQDLDQGGGAAGVPGGAPEPVAAPSGSDFSGGLEVRYDADTGKALLTRDQLDSYLEERLRPTPDQIEQQRRMQAAEQVRSDFVRGDAKRGELMQRAEEAHDFVEQVALTAARRVGQDLSALDTPDAVVSFVRASGALEQAAEQFPDIGSSRLARMLFASAAGSPYMMGEVLEEYAGSVAGAGSGAGGSAELHEVPDDKPRAMATRGGSEPRGKSGKRARYDHLVAQVAKDPFSLSEADYAEFAKLDREFDAA